LIKIKIDECLPHECADLMIQKGCNVETVRQEGLQGSADTEIWNAAQSEERFLLTTDLDFSDMRRYEPGKHAGVLLLRLGKEGKGRMLSYLEWLLASHDISEWKGFLVVATDHKIRIRTAQSTKTPTSPISWCKYRKLPFACCASLNPMIAMHIHNFFSIYSR
jgi:predicted nuclease of predicted toxin-antitoxin system